MDKNTRTKKRPLISNVMLGGSSRLDVNSLRMLAKNEPKLFVERTNKLIQDGKLRLGDLQDIQSVFHALSDVTVPVEIEVGGRMRKIDASAFPLLTGNLTVHAVNAAYEEVPTIGQELVTEMDSNKRVTTIASIHSMDVNKDRVDTDEDFPEIGASEEKAEIRSHRNGRRLTLQAEAIEENDLSDFVERVNALGEISANHIEELTLRRVCDIDGSGASPAEPYVYRPNGAGTALYTTSALTRAPSGTRIENNALADATDLEAARARLSTMTDNRGKRIAIPMSDTVILCPDAKMPTLWTILNSAMTPGQENEVSAWGPQGIYRPKIVSSPKLDDLSATVWYMGIPKRQFRRKWKLRLEFVSLMGHATEAFLRRRIAAEFRVAWDCEVGANDYVYFVQSLPATTAP